jgi:hypothetical protein
MMMPNHIFLHFGNSFNSVFLAQWIEQGGWTAWPTPSPDLNPINLYLGGCLWSTVYSAKFCDVGLATMNKMDLR